MRKPDASMWEMGIMIKKRAIMKRTGKETKSGQSSMVSEPIAHWNTMNPKHVTTTMEICQSSASCDEIGVRLMVIWYSDRAWYEPTLVVWYALVPLAGRRVLLGACSRAPSQEVLRRQKGG